MKPLPYTYKGRPITDYRVPNRLSHRRGGGSSRWLKLLLLLLALGFAFGAVYGIWILAERLLESQNVEQPPSEAFASPRGDSAVPDQPRGETSYPEWRRAFGMSRELYEAGRFDEASETLVGLFAAVPASEKLYNDARNLLFNISSALDRARGAGRISYEEYRVVRGDSLSRIAARNNTSVSEIKRLNELASDSIRVNQVLKLRRVETIASDRSIKISPSGGKIFLYTNGRLWKIYDAEFGPDAVYLSGRYVVSDIQQNPSDRMFGRRLISISRDELTGVSALIQGTGPEGSRPGALSLRLSNDDVQDLADSISQGVIVEISQR